MMAAKLLQAFELASSDVRERVILGIAERLSDDEIQCFRDALQKLERRFDVLCGVSKASRAQMPHEIQLQIVDLLDITDIYYCTNVCRKWRCLLLECRQLSDDLLRKWFPALYHKEGIKSDLLHQAIRRRHLRDEGRFRSRFTCGFLKKSDGVFPIGRVEGLQRGRRFRDLACSASLRIPPQISTLAQKGALQQASRTSDLTPASSINSRDTSGHAVSKYLYADGRLAWQLTPAPGEWVNSIIVHDFHGHRRWDLSLPSMRTRGIKLVLWALGRDLVVARVVGERVLYAWDLVSHAVDRVTLQNPPNRCFTRYRSVVIVTHSGELLLWSFGHGLANVNMTMPQDEEDYLGPAKPKQIPRAPLSAFEIQNSRVMFHPRDEDVFFMATLDDRNHPDEPPLLWVYEFNNKRCFRIFTCSIPPERRLWIVFDAQKVDAHGTYQLLEQQNPTDDGVQLSGVTFNTISKSFGALKFKTPPNTDLDISLVWNDHLLLTYANPKARSMRAYPLVALRQPPNLDSPNAVPDAVSKRRTLDGEIESMVILISPPGHIDTSVVSLLQLLQNNTDALEQGKLEEDIIREPSVSASSADLGLHYVLSFFGGQCTEEGYHVKECPRASGLVPSERGLYPINYCPPNISRDGQVIKAVSILGDDDFLIVVTNRNYYTVFAVDQDGKIAEDILVATYSSRSAS